MKEIALTQGKFALVDDEDYEWLNQWNWYFCKGYARTTIHIGHGHKNRKTYIIQMHQLILNTPKGMDTDHINGIKTDNRRSNLRIATRSQNIINRPSPKTNKSGYKGVYWDKEKKKWGACTRFEGKNIHVGYFDNLIDAARAYNKVIKKYYGEFAWLNKIPERKAI